MALDLLVVIRVCAALLRNDTCVRLDCCRGKALLLDAAGTAFVMAAVLKDAKYSLILEKHVFFMGDVDPSLDASQVVCCVPPAIIFFNSSASDIAAHVRSVNVSLSYPIRRKDCSSRNKCTMTS